MTGSSIVFLEAEKYDLLFLINANLYINIASMGEMEPDIVNTYMNIMRSNREEAFFYCCNRVEKTLPDGTVTRFKDYPWKEGDRILADGLCPWCQKYPLNYPPFWKPFDGAFQHRLALMSK